MTSLAMVWFLVVNTRVTKLASMWVKYHVQMVQGVGEGCF
jgi:hypothetical protein